MTKTTQRDIDRQLWWNSVMRALNGEVELTYNPEPQDVPNGFFDLPHGTVICMPVWCGRSIAINMWLKENEWHRKAVTVVSTTTANEAAKAILKAWKA